MTELTIKRARKILGKLAEGLTDSDLEREIDTAKLLKNIFFNIYAKRRNNNYNGNNTNA